ncbi:MAG: CDP-archaeol synthase [Chlamydiae bacterium]|nr:CDP-archaeol synthase [Chlamydiota bacterium]
MTLKSMPDLKKRLIVSFITLAILTLLLSFYNFIPITILLVLVVSAFVSVGVWEYARLASAKNFHPSVKTMIFFAALEVITFFAAHKNIISADIPTLLLVISVITFFIFHFKGSTDALANVAIEFFGLCYVAIPMSCVLGILYPLSKGGVFPDGRFWLVYLIVVTKISDVAAYFIGKLWGKRKLAPVLSPKKTIEGAVAGFLAAVLFSIIFSLVSRSASLPYFNLPILSALILGVVIGILSQLGDLAESLLKRDAFVKDSNTLPGLGGVLDMLDSLLFTAPVVYFYLKLV